MLAALKHKTMAVPACIAAPMLRHLMHIYQLLDATWCILSNKKCASKHAGPCAVTIAQDVNAWMKKTTVHECRNNCCLLLSVTIF